MGAKIRDLTGLKYSMLTVIKQLPSRDYVYNGLYSKKRMWLCLCECGKKTESYTSQLTTGQKKSCGCLTPTKSAENSRKSRYKLAKKNAGYNNIFARYKANALKRNIEFSIEINNFLKLIKSNCYYCGIGPSNLHDKSYYNVSYNGIDRRNNNEGYTELNSVSCCKMCNISKNNYTEEVFLFWIKRISEYQNKLNSYDNKKTNK